VSENLVTTKWLDEHLENCVIVDASWHLPTTKRDARSEFAAKHIPGAVFYDLDAGADPTTTLPHMLPSQEKFAADMQALGIANDSHVVCYDSVGLFSAARLWWMLKSFGHENVSVLDGGLPKWEREGRAVENGPASAANPIFTAKLDLSTIKSLAEVSSALRDGTAQVADARSPARFRGEEPEPRPGVRPGHMPGACNVHYATLLNTDGTLKSSEALRAAFETAGIDLNRPIITTCGSGVTAAILTLALTELGMKDHGLYDGSWAEWGASGEAVAVG
jgi:thiosulfate/3-mercaptopyruvate sulfurtransferase